MSSPSPADEMGPPSSLEQQRIPSSPPRPASYEPNGRKERRDPSVTPRKFRRFFTPRSHGFQSSSRHALYEMSGTALNRPALSSPARPFQSLNGQDSSPVGFSRELKRRKLIHTPETSPDRTSKRRSLGNEGDSNVDVTLSSPCQRAAPNMSYIDEEEEDTEVEEDQPDIERVPVRRITSLIGRGTGGKILNRSLGGIPRGRQRYEYPVNDWEDNTARFYSKPEDVHMSMSIEHNERTIPFCAKGLNTNSLVAIGDEEGRVRLLESTKWGKPPFATTYVAFRVHTNAIIDMTFSEDDSLLATASGDQSARVVDMTTQQTISILGNHNASLKQVRFQPGVANNSVLATSSRDGSLQIWDLRVNGYEGPSHSIFRPVDDRPNTRSAARRCQYARAVNAIYGAHKVRTRQPPTIGPSDAPTRGEIPGRIGDVSVTAIQFLGNGLEHLLISASESDSSMKLWDIRSLATKRKTQTAVSSTQQPQSHNKWRHFGISSLNLSSDGTRLYSLCKDNTVYAYSTAHLMLGHAPELSVSTSSRPALRPTQEGLGPLYGFRHPQLHATSFYVKSAIRKPKDGKSEMLAVGSSDGCAVLFPTDERYLPVRQPGLATGTNFSTSQQPRPGLRRVGSGLDDSVPISINGTALRRGHDREVASLTWTSEGNLVTVGDDYLVRCWREGDAARDLRTGGEGEGRRWGCGYAEVSEKYDEDEC